MEERGRGGPVAISVGKPARLGKGELHPWEARFVGAGVLMGEGGCPTNEAGRMLGRTSPLCGWALGNIGPRTALPLEVAQGIVQLWWRGDPRGEAPGGDKWRFFDGWPGLESPGAGALWEGGVLRATSRWCQGWPSSRLPWTVRVQPLGR